MEHILKVERRKVARKGGNPKNMRKQGFIPAIIYGNHKEPLAVSVSMRMFKKEFPHISESTIITLQISDEGSRDVLIKDYEYDIVRDELTHIDFYEIERGKKLRTHVSIFLVGNSEGVHLGGILEQFLHELEIECLPRHLPEHVEYNIEAMNIGDGIHVSDLPAQKEVKVLTAQSQLVAQIVAPKQMSLEAETDEDVEKEPEEESDSDEG